MKSLRILLATPKSPYPPTDGGRIAIFEPLRRLAQRGHRITLITFGSLSTQHWTPLQQYCRLEIVDHNTANRILPAVLNLFSSTPYTISKYNSSAMADRMRQLMASERFDLMHIEQLHMAHYLRVAEEFNIPVILRAQNVESLLAERFWREGRGIERLYAWTQLAKLRRFEARACERASMCLTISDVDAERLRQLNLHIKTTVVPAGVDTDYYRPMPGLEEPNTIVFVGSMDWRPNVDAVLWFCDDILPRIERQIQHVKFYIVGKNPPQRIQQLADGGKMIVTGFVEEVREYVAKSSVFIVPLQVGSGMRLKMLQAMAMSKAIVSTSIGAEGIKVTNGRDVLLADTVDDFVQGTIKLLMDAELRHHIGNNARKLVERYYSWNTVIDLTEQIYQDVVQSRVARRNNE